MTDSISFLALGGALEIGANCYYLNIDGTGILIDAGQHPRRQGVQSLPDFSLVESCDLDYVVISHAHQDHIAALPFLIKRFPYLKIIATPQTKQIAFLTLHNAVSILMEQLKDDEELTAYTHEEVELLIRSIEILRAGESMEIQGYNHKGSEPVVLSFFDAGHILGSCSVLFEYKNIKTLYSGDINLSDQRILAGAKVPKMKVNNLILESTNGSAASMELASWKEESERFATAINKIVTGGGSVLIPVFALGKFQEIFAEVIHLMNSRKIPDIPIYSGGLAEKITRLYDGNRYISNVRNPEFEFRLYPRQDLNRINNYEELFKEPSIVLASSGMMLPRTLSYTLGKFWLRKERGAIFTVGYMDPESPGYQFANAKRGDKIKFSDDGEEFRVDCEIQKFRFSAHSTGSELLRIAEMVRPDNVILVHGDGDATGALGGRIKSMMPGAKVFIPEQGKEIKLTF